jgi:hypothetical protein
MAQFNGKGSRPRPLSVPKEVRDTNFENIFGKKPPKERWVYVPPEVPADKKDTNK